MAAWTHPDYGDAAKMYASDSDKSVTVYLESKVVHVYEARTDYVYYPETDSAIFTSVLLRDGAVAGAKDENNTFHSIAENCTIEIYTPAGATVWSNKTTNVTEAGFFKIDWPSTGINTTQAYSGITQIDTVVGGKFRTPFLFNVVPTVRLYNTSALIAERIDIPLSAMQENLSIILHNQTEVINKKMDEQILVIENATEDMMESVNYTLSSFENRTYKAIEDLQTGANQSIAAGQQALNASGQLQETSLRYSWKASVSPDPVLVGDNVTINLQGPGAAYNITPLQPLLYIYSWDNQKITDGVLPDKTDITLTTTNISGYTVTTSSGLYVYKFAADADTFTAGKAYSYIITEQVTGAMVTGSAMVESVSLTTVAGLAAAAPEAVRVAKKALDAIKAVEAVVVTSENINIAVTLKNLKSSVDALPAMLTQESSKDLSGVVNQISDRLKKLVGDEGYDLKQMLGEALSDSPTMKEVKNKTESINSIVDLLLQIFEQKFGGVDTPIVSTSLQSGSVRFRVSVVNPSKVKKQTVEIKNYLPQEIRPKDIIDSGGLDIEYDAERSIYYMYKQEVELEPSEIKVFEVEVEDVWLVPEKAHNDIKGRVDNIMSRLDKTEYAAKGKEIADTIYNVLINKDLRNGMIEAGSANIKRFSWEDAARDTLKIYHNA